MSEALPSPPDRGAALHKLFAYAAISGENMHDALVDEVLADPLAAAAVDQIVRETGVTLNRAIDRLEFASGADDSSPQIIADREFARAQRRHKEALAITGLRFEMDLDGIELRITDPTAFTAALAGMQPSMQERALSQCERTINWTLITTAYTVLQSNSQAVIDVLGPLSPDTEIIDPESISEEDHIVARGFTDHAAQITKELTRLGMPQHVTDTVRQLAIAHEEDLLTNWAIGYDAGILGYSGVPVGTDRLSDQQEWDIVYQYLEHLQRTAPRSRLTQEVRTTLLADIRRALYEPDPTNIPSSGNSDFDAENVKMRNEARQLVRPLLEAALERVQTILPLAGQAPASDLSPVEHTGQGSVQEVFQSIALDIQALQEVGVAAIGLQALLLGVKDLLSSALEGTMNETALEALAPLQAALGHLAAFQEANSLAVEHFRQYKI